MFKYLVLKEGNVPAKFEFYETCDTKQDYELAFDDFPLYKKIAM